jgi:hypothetical protein
VIKFKAKTGRMLRNVAKKFVILTACPFTLCRGFFTPKIVGTFYMQGYNIKEKTAIVPKLFQNSVGTLFLFHAAIH